MSGLLKSLEYSLRYIVLIIIFYFLGIKYIYVPNLLIICLVLQSVMNVKEFKSAYDLVIKRLVRKG